MIHDHSRNLRTLAALLTLGISTGCTLLEPAPANASFASPEAGMQAVLEACRAHDTNRLTEIFGSEYADLISTSDPANDQERRARFVTNAEEHMTLEEHRGTVTAVIGNARWPFPIPIVSRGGAWHFDTAAGVEEIIDRRVGQNELEAIAVCHAYMQAQVDYATVDRDGDGAREYAQRLGSSPGKRDGLYWPSAADEDESPFGPLVTDAGDYADERDRGDPWYGYRFKVLSGQGANATGGKKDYIVNGNMTGGCALAAWPAEPGESGIMSFLVGPDGKVLQKDMGDATSEAMATLEYDPDDTWELADAPGAGSD